jgi:hypothetical protein
MTNAEISMKRMDVIRYFATGYSEKNFVKK